MNQQPLFTPDEDAELKRPLVMPIKPGQTIAVPALSGYVINSIASPACWGISSGLWYCVTHKTAFPDNCAKWRHCKQPGTHIMAWLCKEHGPEVP